MPLRNSSISGTIFANRKAKEIDMPATNFRATACYDQQL